VASQIGCPSVGSSIDPSATLRPLSGSVGRRGSRARHRVQLLACAPDVWARFGRVWREADILRAPVFELGLQLPDPPIHRGQFSALNAGPAGLLTAVDEGLGLPAIHLSPPPDPAPRTRPPRTGRNGRNGPARTPAGETPCHTSSASRLQAVGTQPVSQTEVKFRGPDQGIWVMRGDCGLTPYRFPHPVASRPYI